MATLDTPATLGAAADVHVELPADGLAGNFGLELLSNLQFGDDRATVGASVGQVGFEDFVDLVLGRRGSVSVGSVLVTSFAPGFLGVGFGRSFSEGCRLSFALALGVFELCAQASDLGLQRLDLAVLLLDGVQKFVIARLRICHRR
jgi:hypothetical protein